MRTQNQPVSYTIKKGSMNHGQANLSNGVGVLSHVECQRTGSDAEGGRYCQLYPAPFRHREYGKLFSHCSGTGEQRQYHRDRYLAQKRRRRRLHGSVSVGRSERNRNPAIQRQLYQQQNYQRRDLPHGVLCAGGRKWRE